MLSFKQSEDAIVVGMFQHLTHKSKNRIVFYSPTADGDDALNRPYDHGEFVPFMPSSVDGDRVVYYLFGASGSGKSTLAQKINKLYDKISIKSYIISPIQDSNYKAKHLQIDQLVAVHEDDQSRKKKYEEMKIRFKYKKQMIEDLDQLCEMEIALNDMKPSVNEKEASYEFTPYYKKKISKPTLFVFDDNEAQESDRLTYLMNNQLICGRHDNISMLILNHLGNKGHQTRNMINESNIFIFLGSFSRYINYFLREYLQLTNLQIREIHKLLNNSRYVAIYRNPRIILSQNKMLTY